MTSLKRSDATHDPGADEDRHTCVDCDQRAPPTETNYTLISQRHGWRLTRAEDSQGRRTMEWRCPNCYARFRGKQLTKR